MLLFYSRKGELPLGKLSDRLQVHRASVTNVVDKLVDRGYVERVGHQQDRRAILARITKDGKRIAGWRRSGSTQQASGWRRSTTRLATRCTRC